MRSALFYVPIWVFALGALWIGASHPSHANSNLYVGLGGMGIVIVNALMLQHRRISELERKLELL